MKVYHLCLMDSKSGNEVWLGTFDNEDTLLAAIPERPKLIVKDGKIVPAPTSADEKLDKYRVHEITLNELRTDPFEIDLPDACVSVRSESDSSKLYGVAIRGGKIVGCSCPDFEFTRAMNGDKCKHMRGVETYPYDYGLSTHGFNISTPLGTFYAQGSSRGSRW